MVATYQAGATNRDVVRLLIRDTDVSQPVFEDDEIDVFVNLERDVRYAAAQALDTIAIDQVRLLKVITLFELKVDGGAVARSLQASAKILRDLSDTEPYFDWAEEVTSAEQERERLLDSLLRGKLLFRGLI